MKKRLYIKQFLALVAFYSFATFSESNLIATHKKFEEALLANQRVITFSGDNFKLEDVPQFRIKPKNPQKKQWTFIVYVAADNDLRAFAYNNIKQMASVGSNEYLNIVVHVDIRFINNNKKSTVRYYIEKDRFVQPKNNSNFSKPMDSGDPQTLISCCEWAINDYPAENYALILWNHGTGIIDPKNYKIINPAELFSFNPKTNKLDLDRTIGFLDLLYFFNQDERGICWDNSTGNYLTNKKLDFALNEICTRIMKNKKFSLIGFDACLMSMLEVGVIIKNYADVMVGSQEVELGTGWNYSQVLKPLSEGDIDKYTLAKKIVGAFQRTYHHITNDYTQSAIDLTLIHLLEKNVDEVSTLLIECLSKQRNNSVTKVLTESKSPKYCTHFDEPSYIDLHHFYLNLQGKLNKIAISGDKSIISKLQTKLQAGREIIQKIVFSNTAGKNLQKAKGLSIYFPRRRIHPSYECCTFAKNNAWYSLLTKFLAIQT